jgi:CheY-like chemotaxis protein
VTVTDTGPGIPADHVEHVWDRFWRGRREDKSGVGLGLSIVKGLVEAHGGRVWLQSEQGKGATFHFTLPPVAATRGEPAPPPRPTVLVVDDDPSIRKAIEKALTGASYRVITAADGGEALERLQAEGAQVIILDLMMPKMDGLAFRALQNADPRLAKIPTLVITAYGKLREELDLPADACIQKPFRMRELVSLVGKVIKPRSID